MLSTNRLLATIARLRLALVSFVVGLALITGLVRAGRTYFYCPAMNEITAHSCCETSNHRERVPADRVEPTNQDCCEPGQFAVVPRGSVTQPPETPSAPLIAVLSPPRETPSYEPVLTVRPRVDLRVTGPPRTARERRALSQVFLL